MIRIQTGHLAHARSASLLVRLWRRICVEKNHFALRLSTEISPNAAPATKNDTCTSPSTAPATKSDSPTSKTHSPTSANAAPATKSCTPTSPKPRKVTVGCVPQMIWKLFSRMGGATRPHLPTVEYYCACEDKNTLTKLACETSFTMCRETGPTLKRHQNCPCHEKWLSSLILLGNVNNARSNSTHPPTSPNTAPGTKNDSPKYEEKLLKTDGMSFTMPDDSTAPVARSTLQVKMSQKTDGLGTFWSWDVENCTPLQWEAHCTSKCHKNWWSRSTFSSGDVMK